MDFSELSGWALPGALSPFLILVGYLARELTITRREVSERDARIDGRDARVEAAHTDRDAKVQAAREDRDTKVAAMQVLLDAERVTRFDAEERAERAEARAAGFEERIQHLETEIRRLRELIEGGAGDAG